MPHQKYSNWSKEEASSPQIKLGQDDGAMDIMKVNIENYLRLHFLYLALRISLIVVWVFLSSFFFINGNDI